MTIDIISRKMKDYYATKQMVCHHDSFFRDKPMVLLIKVFNREAEPFKDSTLPVDFTCDPYLVTNAWNKVENFMLFNIDGGDVGER